MSSPDAAIKRPVTMMESGPVGGIIASAEVGKPLGESGLSERDITVLTLHRGVLVIPNPRPRHVLEDGDRLLCWGKLEEMRSMIPERPKRRSRVKKLPKQPIHDV